MTKLVFQSIYHRDISTKYLTNTKNWEVHKLGIIPIQVQIPDWWFFHYFFTKTQPTPHQTPTPPHHNKLTPHPLIHTTHHITPHPRLHSTHHTTPALQHTHTTPTPPHHQGKFALVGNL